MAPYIQLHNLAISTPWIARKVKQGVGAVYHATVGYAQDAHYAWTKHDVSKANGSTMDEVPSKGKFFPVHHHAASY